jgi:hypothetical protein
MLSQLFPETAHVTVPAGPSEGLKGEPTPEEEMLIRIAQLTAELTYAEPAPELSIISQESKNAGPASDAERASELAILMRVVQIMEDTWLTCQLDDWWSHPLNLGWTNYFARWATAPSFRFWWPVMSPMCTPAFRNFIEDRYPMPAGASSTDVRFGSPQRGKVSELDKSDWNGLAATWWQTLPSIKPGWFDAKTFEQGKGQTIYQHKVRLTGKPEEPVWMQVGLVGVLSDTKTLVGWSSDDSDWVALVGWSSDDFFVPPSLWGAAMGWHFLDELLRKLAAKSENTHCYVVVKAPPEDANYRVTRDDRRRFIEQYREIGFRQVLGSLDLLNEQFSETDQAHKRTVGGDSFPVDRAFATKLGYDDSCDTLFVLDLKQWLERQRKPTS